MGVYFPSYRASGYHVLYSDPTSADTDGDGLGDYEETNENYEIVYTDSPDATRGFFSALHDDDQNPSAYLTPRPRGSSAMQADSDDDGLSDREEVLLGTDAKKRDTDGDGIPDGEEDRYGGDATLFDAQPPRIEVWYANFHKPAGSLETTYTVSFTATDPSGVERVAVLKDNEARFKDSPTGYPYSTSYGFVEFKTGAGETLLDGLAGATVDVEAEDRHANNGRIRALERSDIYGHMASELGADTIDTLGIASDLGAMSGFTTGAGETGEMIEAIVTDPYGFVTAITKIVEVLDKWHLLDDILRAVPGAVDRKQDQQNPYDKETQPELYQEYRWGWIGGYAGYFVFEMAVGARAAKLVKNSKTFAKTVDALDRDGKLTDAVQYYRSAKGTATAPVRKGGYLLAKGVVKGTDHSLAASRQVLSGVRTVGRQYTVSQSLRRADPGFVDGLSKANQRTLGRFLAQADESGLTIVADGGGDMLAIFRRMPDVDPQTVRRLDGLEDRSVISDTDIHRLVRAKEDGVIDGNDLRRITKLLDPDASEYVVGDNIGTTELLKVAQKNSDISSTKFVVKRDGQVKWLELGKESDGWIHIQSRHSTDFRSNSRLNIDSDEDIKDIVIETIENGDGYQIPKADGGGTVYVSEYNGQPVSVIVGDNGYVVTSYPGLAKHAKS